MPWQSLQHVHVTEVSGSLTRETFEAEVGASCLRCITLFYRATMHYLNNTQSAQFSSMLKAKTLFSASVQFQRSWDPGSQD
eukprot:1140748-Pelagomonas_calceolata.AAC.1